MSTLCVIKPTSLPNVTLSGSSYNFTLGGLLSISLTGVVLNNADRAASMRDIAAHINAAGAKLGGEHQVTAQEVGGALVVTVDGVQDATLTPACTNISSSVPVMSASGSWSVVPVAQTVVPNEYAMMTSVIQLMTMAAQF